jgi:hypothetical protein
MMFKRTTLSARNVSGFRGVSFEAHARKWRARIYVAGKKIHLGYFPDKRDAAAAYQAAVQRCTRSLHAGGVRALKGAGGVPYPSPASIT